MNHEGTPMGDALDRRIDAALRRRFAPPPDLSRLAERVARPRTEPRRGPWLALLALAALAFLVLRLVLPAPPPERAPAKTPDPGGLELCSLVGPLQETAAEPGAVHRPDLGRLYREMDACQRSSMPAACDEGDRLAERLSLTYGQAVVLRPDASGHLHGPFGSADWPTGTIVTATLAEHTAVLVADRDATLACCVHPRLAEGSGLRTFTRAVGSLVLTEITPLEEPALLAYFE
jgi:hypothetical protein